MDWAQFTIMFITFVGIFLWNRTESRADIRHMDTKLESNKNLSMEIHKENKEIIQQIRTENQQMIEKGRIETQQIILAIQTEMKEFHGRLCIIEERNRDKR